MAQPPSGEGRKVAKNMLAGALSGATEIMIMYPTGAVPWHPALAVGGIFGNEAALPTSRSYVLDRIRKDPDAAAEASGYGATLQEFLGLCRACNEYQWGGVKCAYRRRLRSWVRVGFLSRLLQKTIVRQRGYLALYRGLSSLLLGTVPKTTARFTVFSWLKRMMTVRPSPRCHTSSR